MNIKYLTTVVSEIMSRDFPFVTEKMVFINTDKTACLSIGKTFLDRRVMLYVYAKVWNGASWYLDELLVCRNAEDIMSKFSAWIRQHGDRRGYAR